MNPFYLDIQNRLNSNSNSWPVMFSVTLDCLMNTKENTQKQMQLVVPLLENCITSCTPGGMPFIEFVLNQLVMQPNRGAENPFFWEFGCQWIIEKSIQVNVLIPTKWHQLCWQLLIKIAADPESEQSISINRLITPFIINPIFINALNADFNSFLFFLLDQLIAEPEQLKNKFWLELLTKIVALSNVNLKQNNTIWHYIFKSPVFWRCDEEKLLYFNLPFEKLNFRNCVYGDKDNNSLMVLADTIKSSQSEILFFYFSDLEILLKVCRINSNQQTSSLHSSLLALENAINGKIFYLIAELEQIKESSLSSTKSNLNKNLIKSLERLADFIKNWRIDKTQVSSIFSSVLSKSSPSPSLSQSHLPINPTLPAANLDPRIAYAKSLPTKITIVSQNPITPVTTVTTHQPKFLNSKPQFFLQTPELSGVAQKSQEANVPEEFEFIWVRFKALDSMSDLANQQEILLNDIKQIAHIAEPEPFLFYFFKQFKNFNVQEVSHFKNNEIQTTFVKQIFQTLSSQFPYKVGNRTLFDVIFEIPLFILLDLFFDETNDDRYVLPYFLLACKQENFLDKIISYAVFSTFNISKLNSENKHHLYTLFYQLIARGFEMTVETAQNLETRKKNPKNYNSLLNEFSQIMKVCWESYDFKDKNLIEIKKQQQLLFFSFILLKTDEDIEKWLEEVEQSDEKVQKWVEQVKDFEKLKEANLNYFLLYLVEKLKFITLSPLLYADYHQLKPKKQWIALKQLYNRVSKSDCFIKRDSGLSTIFHHLFSSEYIVKFVTECNPNGFFSIKEIPEIEKRHMSLFEIRNNKGMTIGDNFVMNFNNYLTGRKIHTEGAIRHWLTILDTLLNRNFLFENINSIKDLNQSLKILNININLLDKIKRANASTSTLPEVSPTVISSRHSSVSIPKVQVSSLTIEPNHLIKHLHDFNIQVVTSLYSQLATEVVKQWNMTSIQENLRRLIAVESGLRQIDLAKAQVDDVSGLDLQGINHILKPFFEFYQKFYAKEPVLVQIILQDAIQSLGLAFTGDLVYFQNAFKTIFPSSFISFLIESLNVSLSENLKAKKFLEAKHVSPIFADQERHVSLLGACRDLLFYLGLNQLKARALKLIDYAKSSNLNELRLKPTILLYIHQNKTHPYLLSVVQEMPFNVVKVIGTDTTNKEAQLILEQAIGRQINPDQILELSAEELKKLKDYHQTEDNAKKFYLLTPIPSELLRSINEPLTSVSSMLSTLKEIEKDEIENVTESKMEVDIQISEQKHIPPQLEKIKRKVRDELVPLISPQKKEKINQVADSAIRSTSMPTQLRAFSTSVASLEGVSSHFEEENETHEKESHQKTISTKSRSEFQRQEGASYQSSTSSHAKKTRQKISKSSQDVFINTSLNTAAVPTNLEVEDEADPLVAVGKLAIQRINHLVSFVEASENKALMSSTNSFLTVYSKESQEIQFGNEELKSYQKDAVKKIMYLSKNGLNGFVAFAPGLGKTLVACEVIYQMQRSDINGAPTLIIVPKGLIQQWKNVLLATAFKLRKHYYLDLSSKYAQLNSPQREKLAKAIVNFYFSHWQVLNANKDEIEKELSKRIDGAREVLQKAMQTPGLACRIIVEFSLSLQTIKIDAGLFKELRNDKNLLIDSFIETLTISTSAISKEVINRLNVGLNNFNQTRKLLEQFNSPWKDILCYLLDEVHDAPIVVQAALEFLVLVSGQQIPNGQGFSLNEVLLKNMYDQVKKFEKVKEGKSQSQVFRSNQWQMILVTPETFMTSQAYFKASNWKLIINDEAHQHSREKLELDLNDQRESDRFYRLVRDLCQPSHVSSTQPTILLLTGTPFVNQYKDVLSLLQLANPDKSLIEFNKILKIRENNMVTALGRLEKAVQKEDPILINVCQMELKKQMAEWLIAIQRARTITQFLIDRRSPSDVKEDWIVNGRCLLPQPIHQSIELNLTSEQLKLYEQYEKSDFLHNSHLFSVLTVHPDLITNEKWNDKKQIRSYFAKIKQEIEDFKKIEPFKSMSQEELKPYFEKMAREKLDLFISRSALLTELFKAEGPIAKALEEKKKVLVFASHITSCVLIKCLFDLLYPGHRMRLYNGKKNTKKRTEVISDFQQQQSVNLTSNKSPVSALALTPEAGGVGLDLTEAKVLINLVAGWNRTGTQQIIARALRAGIEGQTLIYTPNYNFKLQIHKELVVAAKEAEESFFLSRDNVNATTLQQLKDYIIKDRLEINLRSKSNLTIVKNQFEKAKQFHEKLLEDSLKSLEEDLNNPASVLSIRLKEMQEIQVVEQPVKQTVVPSNVSQKITAIQPAPVSHQAPSKLSNSNGSLPMVRQTSTASISKITIPASLPSKSNVLLSTPVQKKNEPSIVFTTSTQATESSSVKLSRELQTQGLKVRLIPLATNDEATAKQLAYEMNDKLMHDKAFIGKLMQELSEAKLADSEWIKLINDPAAFLQQSHLSESLKQLGQLSSSKPATQVRKYEPDGEKSFKVDLFTAHLEKQSFPRLLAYKGANGKTCYCFMMKLT